MAQQHGNSMFSKVGRQYPNMAGKIPQSDQAIMVQIAQEAADRSRKGIKQWREALESADDPQNPNWSALQDLYEYLRTDGHLGSQMTIRKGSILSNRFFIRDGKTGKENPDKTKLLEKKWFFDLLGELLDNILLGYTVVQFPDPIRVLKPHPLQNAYDLIPRRNFIPQKNMILKEANGTEGFLITDPAFMNTIICIKNQERFGLLNDLVPGLIWKKNARQGWAEFGEKFGLPLVKVTTNKTAKADLDKMEYMAKQMAEAARAILPTGTTMDIVDTATKGDPYKVYLEQITYTDNEVSKRILGGTMISDNGSSRSQSEVHERTLDTKISEMDRKDMEFTINDQLIPYLINIGYGLQEGDEWVLDRTIALSMSEAWKMFNEALQHFDLDTEQVAERFNLPIVGLKNKQDANFNQPLNAVASFRGANWPHYTASSCCSKHNRYKAEGNDAEFTKTINDLQEEILKNVFDGKPALAEWMMKSIAVGGKYREALFNGWGDRRLQIAYDATDHRALAMMEMNLFQFAALREKASVLQLNKLLIDADGKKLREYNEFKKLALPHLKNMNADWLQAEYNFSVATGQTASQFHQYLSEANTVTRLVQYITAGDDRVRPKHQALNLKVFSIDDPEARLLWPPNDWGCRCEFIQYLGKPPANLMTTGKEGINLIDWNDKQTKQFAVNRGDIGQVFLQNQMYMKEAGLAADIASMAFDKYGLQEWKAIKENYKPVHIDETITQGNVHELFKREEGENVMVYTDYLNRKISLKRSVFDEHTSGRYVTGEERRHQIFPLVNDVLNDPDEVYLNQYRKGVFQFQYVKLYKDTVITVPVKLGKQNLEVSTWYEMKAKETTVRNGLLIKKKP